MMSKAPGRSPRRSDGARSGVEVLGQLELLPLIAGTERRPVGLARSFQHFLEHQAADGLAVAKGERRLVAADFQHAAGAPVAGQAVAVRGGEDGARSVGKKGRSGFIVLAVVGAVGLDNVVAPGFASSDSAAAASQTEAPKTSAPAPESQP